MRVKDGACSVFYTSLNFVPKSFESAAEQVQIVLHFIFGCFGLPVFVY